MKTLNIGSILNEIESENEKKSWEKRTVVHYRINAVVNGYGLSRTVPAQDERHLHGLTETSARAIIKTLQKKGFDATLARTTETIERLI